MVEPMIYESPCLLFEALNYAKKRINGIKKDQADRLIDPSLVSKIDALIKPLDDMDIKEPSLFQWLNHTNVCIADIICYSFGLTIVDMMQSDYKDRLIQAIESIIYQKVGNITLVNHLDFDLNHPYQTVLDGLIKLNLDDHDKLMLIDKLYHPRVTVNALVESLDPLVQVLQTMVESVDLSGYHTFFKRHDAFSFLDHANVHIQGKIMVLPSLIESKNLLVNITDHDDILVIYGLAIDPTKINDHDFYCDETSRRLDYFIKVLNDQSKLKLISLLKQKKMYGAQLANATGLKPSTISYHLDTLMNAGMVKTTKENNRIWFEYDSDHTMMLFDELKKIFE